MKVSRDAAALAASLTSAASAPLQAPERRLALAPMPEQVAPQPPKEVAAPKLPKQSKKMKELADTVQMTLRPSRQLAEDYVIEAAERSKRERRVISAQQIMLEVLENGLKVRK